MKHIHHSLPAGLPLAFMEQRKMQPLSEPTRKVSGSSWLNARLVTPISLSPLTPRTFMLRGKLCAITTKLQTECKRCYQGQDGEHSDTRREDVDKNEHAWCKTNIWNSGENGWQSFKYRNSITEFQSNIQKRVPFQLIVASKIYLPNLCRSGHCFKKIFISLISWHRQADWQIHTDTLCFLNFWIFKKLVCPQSCCQDTKTSLHLSISLVRSKLIYGQEVYFSAPNTPKETAKRIKTVQSDHSERCSSCTHPSKSFSFPFFWSTFHTRIFPSPPMLITCTPTDNHLHHNVFSTPLLTLTTFIPTSTVLHYSP